MSLLLLICTQRPRLLTMICSDSKLARTMTTLRLAEVAVAEEAVVVVIVVPRVETVEEEAANDRVVARVAS